MFGLKQVGDTINGQQKIGQHPARGHERKRICNREQQKNQDALRALKSHAGENTEQPKKQRRAGDQSLCSQPEGDGQPAGQHDEQAEGRQHHGHVKFPQRGTEPVAGDDLRRAQGRQPVAVPKSGLAVVGQCAGNAAEAADDQNQNFHAHRPAVKSFPGLRLRVETAESDFFAQTFREAEKQAETNQRGDQHCGQHAAAMHQAFVREKNGVLGKFHISSFAPDCKKICSRSSPTARHSQTRTPCTTSVLSSSSSASSSPSKSNAAPRPAASKFFTAFWALKICCAAFSSTRHFKDMRRLPICCPSSAMVPNLTSLPRSMIAALLQKPESSVRMCEEIKTALPASRSWSKIFRSSMRPSGSRPLAGSSSRRTCGSGKSVLASTSRCFMPRESSSHKELRLSVSQVSSRHSSMRFARFGTSKARAKCSRNSEVVSWS